MQYVCPNIFIDSIHDINVWRSAFKQLVECKPRNIIDIALWPILRTDGPWTPFIVYYEIATVEYLSNIPNRYTTTRICHKPLVVLSSIIRICKA